MFPASGQRPTAEGTERKEGSTEKAGDGAVGPEGIPGWASQPQDDV